MKKKYFVTVFLSAFLVNANAQTLNYKVITTAARDTVVTVCNGAYGQCSGPNTAGTMDIGEAFCLQLDALFKSTFVIYKLDNINKPATGTFWMGMDGKLASDGLENATVAADYQSDWNKGKCPSFYPKPDAYIAYQILNNTSRPLTFLQVFTTENNGTTPDPDSSTSWWKYWHKDESISLKPGTVLEPNRYFPDLGATAWFDDSSRSNGTRWFITYSHGDDCYSTTFYSDEGIYFDQTNLCDYTSADKDDVKYRPAALNIVDGSANMLYPTL